MLSLPGFLFAATICGRGVKHGAAVRRINGVGNRARDEKCIVVATK